MVWKLDLLGRSLCDLIDLVAVFQEKGLNLMSLQDGINLAKVAEKTQQAKIFYASES